jgi:hypothetical protein
MSTGNSNEIFISQIFRLHKGTANIREILKYSRRFDSELSIKKKNCRLTISNQHIRNNFKSFLQCHKHVVLFSTILDLIKYIGMTIDSKLTWKQHIAKKRKQINITIKQLTWLLGRKSNLAIKNKLLIYKTIIIPI